MARQFSHHPIDPAYSPHTVISRRLIEANKVHSSRLAERCTVYSSSQPYVEEASVSSASQVVHPLAQLAINRTACPLDDGLTRGSSTSAKVHLVTDVKLTALERAAPHRIVVPADEADAFRGEVDGSDMQLKSRTWNAITALSTLCDEVFELEKTFSTLIPSLVLFEVSCVDKLDEVREKKRHSELLKSIGKFMPTLQLVQNGCLRLKRLVNNMVVQLGGCATPSTIDADAQNGEVHQPILGADISLLAVGKAIGTAFRLLITADSAVDDNNHLKEAWGMYKDVVMDHSEEKRAANTWDSDFESFERMLIQLDYSLMSSRSFISAVEQNFDPNGRFAAANFNLYDEIHSMTNALYGQYCERINTEHETTERLDCVGVYALYVLYRHLLPMKCVPDPKLHKNLWSVFPAMCPVLEIHGPLHFIPREFIMIHVPYESIKGCSADVNEIRENAAALVLKWDGSFRTRANKIKLDALAWLAVADAELSSTVDEDNGANAEFNTVTSVESIERATSCILRGIKIAHAASITLRGQLIAHKALGLDHDPKLMAPCLSLLVVLKSVEKMLLVRRRTAVLAFQRGTLKMIASNILKRFEQIRAFVDQYSTSESSRSLQRASSFAVVSACLSALEGLLKGSSSFSPIRRHAITLTVSACMDRMVLERFATDDLATIEGHLKDLNEIASIEEVLAKVCDCSFIYFYRDLYPTFFEYMFETSLNSPVGHIHLVTSALSDPIYMIKNVKHADSGACLEDYQSYILDLIREEVIVPTCEVIESNLRLAQQSRADHKQNYNYEKYDAQLVRSLLLDQTLHVCLQPINLKAEIERGLGKIFYNLCALNLNECNAYTEMSSIAKERFGLKIADPYLPDGNLDQRFDLIGILRDFESFIRKFNYNMMEENFVERKPERGAKFLATVGIKCITASIKQHGFGIIKSAVNIAHELLEKKYELLARFLSNDSIKSLLSKELRWIANQRSDGQSFYTFDRAAALSQEINNRKNSADNAGNPSLEECRELIISIGNIIAFVRMATTASKKVLGDEMSCLPNRLHNPKAKIAAKRVLSVVHEQQNPDYIREFVDAFKGLLQADGFFSLVPVFCLNWMDASIQGKEIMHKKSITNDGYYTDDGFAVGLTFCLVALDQVKQYESLHWFKSVQNKYATDEEDLIEKENAQDIKTKAKRAAGQGSWFSSGETTVEDDNEVTVLRMMRKRLESNQREMAMLFFTMNGAERFFKEIQSNV